ncbi:hypothetical protein V2O64_19285 [Verrucomicrobiaceae bacterium 227]
MDRLPEQAHSSFSLTLPKTMTLSIKQLSLSALLGSLALATFACKDDPAGSTTNSADARAASAVKQTCTVSPADFASWFVSGEVTPNGVVKPANSLVDFETPGEFYQWSWQMFLWQTSPNDGGLVFNTPPFYDLDAAGNLTTNTAGKSKLQRIRGAKDNNEKVAGTGQAGMISGVLMTQDTGISPDGSLVYYALHVNDVYAYMASGINSKELTGLNQFPTTQPELQSIINYAGESYGASLPDSQALTLELKSSWVKADPSLDLSQYLTITADVPLYTRESDLKWTWDGSSMEKDVTLACIGYHLVGPSSGHPEMIWATFEHVSNAPDANYYYLNGNSEVTVKINWTSNDTPVEKDWLLMSPDGTRQASNQMHMEVNGPAIVATPGNVISASDSSRTHPWGNKPDEASAANNTDIISLNENIQSMLAEADPRRNYFLVGATWTRNGVPGVGLQLPDVAGSMVLANTSMETYFQSKNCFDCHQGGKLDGLSHVFTDIKPLPKPIRK